MILRFKLYSIAGATALLSTPGDAFSVQSTITSRTNRGAPATSSARHSSRLSPDWDNEDFLSSLGGGQDAQEKANDKYYKQAESRAKIDDWRWEQMQQQQQKEQAQQQPPPPVAPQQPPQMQPPPQMGAPQMQPPQQTQAPPPAQFYDANGNPVSMPMVYDANGNLVPFNPAMQQPPAAAAAAQPAQPQMPAVPMPIIEPPLPPKTKGTDSPRPEGQNADAYTMSNTADVYFAQLKRDSKVRKIARMSGDLETANQVFADDSVKQIGDSWNENPYTKEKNLAEARSEIEGTVRMQVSGGDSDASKLSSGVSYREQLEQMKRSNNSGVGGAPVAQAPPAAAAAPQMVGTPVPPSVGQTMQSSPPVASTPPATTAAASSDDGVHGKIRTAQGLLLKQRGGPGFGAGRLKAPEAQRLEDTLDDVSGILRSEAGMGSKPAAAVESKPIAATTASPTHTIPASPAVPTPAQAALVVATSTPQNTPDPLAGTVACVEAALNMYKNSSPADKEAMMVPLREALMAAAASSNKYMAETELSKHKAAMEDGPSGAVMEAAAASVTAPAAQEPMMGFPATYEVTKPDNEPAAQSSPAAPPAVMDKAEHEKKLQDVYSALSTAGGAGGKLGLRNNIGGDEASELVEQLVTMRSVLLDELNSGD